VSIDIVSGKSPVFAGDCHFGYTCGNITAVKATIHLLLLLTQAMMPIADAVNFGIASQQLCWRLSRL